MAISLDESSPFTTRTPSTTLAETAKWRRVSSDSRDAVRLSLRRIIFIWTFRSCDVRKGGPASKAATVAITAGGEVAGRAGGKRERLGGRGGGLQQAAAGGAVVAGGNGAGA